MFKFNEKWPNECHWFAFVDPDDNEYWVTGWVDMHHIRTPCGRRFLHQDERLTWWVPLPNVPPGI